MPDCHKTEDLLSDYIEGSLDIKEKEAVTNHLKVCSNCSETYHSLRRLLCTLPDLSVEPPVFLRNRLLMIPPPSIEIKEQRITRLKWFAAITVSFAILLNLFYFTNFNPRMNKFLHKVVYQIQKIKVNSESFLGAFKRKKIFFSQDNSLMAISTNIKPLSKKEIKHVK
jgi:hypothetical protein